MNGPALTAVAALEAELLALRRHDCLGELVILRSRPARAVVVGRVGAGKTSLVRRLGGDGPVGLGGVTRGPVTWVTADRILVDTPGIDDPDKAIDALGPLTDDADEVFWVVDGLQPATASERAVLPHLLARAPALRAVISRGDLVDAPEQREIVARVVRLGAPFGLAEAWIGDLRRQAPAFAVPSGFRDAAVRRFADSLPARLGVPDAPPALALRQEVHEALHESLGLVESGVLADPAAALAHFQALSDELAAKHGLPAPPPEPRPDVADRWLGGKALARRRLTQAAARVLGELEASAERPMARPEQRALLAAKALASALAG